MGDVGIRPNEFWSMTWVEIEMACRSYEIKMAREREVERLIATILINANRKNGVKAYRPEDVIPLITDYMRKPVGLISREEFEKAKELMSNVVWQTQN